MNIKYIIKTPLKKKLYNYVKILRLVLILLVTIEYPR